jgi:hypothetical protein
MMTQPTWYLLAEVMTGKVLCVDLYSERHPTDDPAIFRMEIYHWPDTDYESAWRQANDLLNRHPALRYLPRSRALRQFPGHRG